MAFVNTNTPDSLNNADPEATLVMPRNLMGRSTVAGLFDTGAQAQQAIQDLKAAGFTDDQIGIGMRDRTEQGHLIEDTGVSAHNTETGATTGAVTGGVLGLLVGLGALAIPGIGPVIAGGALASGLAGAVTGAAAGGILGGLLGMGIPEHEAHHFASGVKAGRALVTVQDPARMREALDILERNGADTGANIEAEGLGQPQAFADTPAATMPALSAAPATPFPANPALNAAITPASDVDTAQRVQLHAEQLNVQKQAVQTGEVVLHKEVVTETRSIDVPVTREEVVIERRPVTPGQVGATDTTGTTLNLAPDEVIRVPVMEEQVTIQKTPIVTEEISLHKRQVQETQHVTETVHREQARIENPQNVDMLQRGTTTAGTVANDIDGEMDRDELVDDVNINQNPSRSL